MPGKLVGLSKEEVLKEIEKWAVDTAQEPDTGSKRGETP